MFFKILDSKSKNSLHLKLSRIKYIFIIIFISFISFWFIKHKYQFLNYTFNKYDTEKTYDYIIVGAGPAGLQTAYFLQKFNQEYLVLERSNNVGNFFKKYPIHRKLISINKVNTGSQRLDFNLRHDWNSLISDNHQLLMKYYTSEYFPSPEVYLQYLKDYYQYYKLKIYFDQDIFNIFKQNDIFYIMSQNNIIFKCRKLIIATGLFTPHSLSIKNSISYSNLDLDKKKFQNKKILIVGQGNSAFETADYLIDTASTIHILGRQAPRFAWQTHYAGDLRAVNNNFLDTYQLKSQNGIITDYQEDIFKQINKIDLKYDIVIDCTGFKFDYSIFDKNISHNIPDNNQRVPILRSNFESSNISNLFFSGTLMQYISYKKSSGAFIHGFRHLIESMVRIETNNLLTTEILHLQQLENKIIDRINNSPEIFQMFGCLSDIFIVNNNNNNNKNNEIIYIENLPIKYVIENYINKYPKVIIIYLNYGKNYGGHINQCQDLGKSTYVFGNDRVQGDNIEKAELSNFIHPIFEYYKDQKLEETFHLPENLENNFSSEEDYIMPLNNFLNKI